MRSHAKASTAGSTKTRRAVLPFGAFAAILAALALIAALASAAVPTATTGSASNIQKTTATLNGTVNPQGALLEECKFEWGTTTGYGQSQACNLTPAEIGTGSSAVAVKADIAGLSVGTTYHFRLVAKNSEGVSNGLDKTFKTLSPPVVQAFATDVFYGDATLNAAINPEGFATTYKFQWGPTAAYGSETAVANVGSDKTVHQLSHRLSSLPEGTTYHYRVVATNANGTTETPDHTLTTYTREPQDIDCPNQANRFGASANLPDCRAYEMVSPVDKGGVDVLASTETTGQTTRIDQATPGGGKLAYTAYRAFGDAKGSYFSNQFIATRGASGWTTHGINPLQEDGTIFSPEFTGLDLKGQYEAFTEDLSTGWLLNDAKPTLTPDAVPGWPNFYSQDLTTETFHALTTLAPTVHYGFRAEAWYMALQGYSRDGSHAVLTARANLTPDAAASTEPQLYDYSGGQLHLVSVLPNGLPNTEGSVISGTFPGLNYHGGAFQNAVSVDGSRIFWSSSQSFDGLGRIFVRIDGEQTIPVSESVSSALAQFWGASANGGKAIFSIGQTLYEFDVDSETVAQIAEGVSGVMGTSEDLSRIYFVSDQALAPGAQAGSQNLYLDHAGTMTYIGTLARLDVSALESGPGGYSTVSIKRENHVAKVSADGRYLVFNSEAPLTGYDNTSRSNGEAAVEVYRYDADSGQLACVSCNPGGARPYTEALPEPFVADFGYLYENEKKEHIWAAGWLTTGETRFRDTRALSQDGSRVFFNSFDALLPRDTNGAQDVYEWEAPGSGSCTAGDPSYSARNAGCVYLISTGKSPRISTFVEASADGGSAFFETQSSIAPRDPGLIDIYVARAGGGFPPSAAGPNSCIGDACQAVPSSPSSPTPASATFHGAGDPRATPPCGATRRRAARLSRQAKRALRRGSQAQAGRLKRRAKALRQRAARCRKAARRAGA